jgi:hypothetical protein
MIEVGLWIRTAADVPPAPDVPPETALPLSEEVFLIKKDPAGHPTLSVLQSAANLSPAADVPPETTAERPLRLDTVDQKKAKIRFLYENLTGHPHPHAHATSRQLMWDLIEAATKRLA